VHRIVYAEWGAAEYRAALGCLLRGRASIGDAAAELTSRLEALYPGSTVMLVNRGRFALRLALQAFSRLRPGKTEVVYPAYICASVIDAIVGAELVPVPADIGPDLNMGVAQAERAIGPRTLAVIAVHLYGSPAPIAELEQLTRSRGIFLVDDAAAVAGVAADNGRMLGGCGDAGVLSFTGSKSIVAGGFNAGGVLLVNDPDLAPAMRRQWEQLPGARYSLADFLRFLRDQQFEPYTEKAAYYWIEALRRLRLNSERPRGVAATRMPNLSASVALQQLASLPQRIAGRIRVAESFARHLRDVPAVALPQYRPGRYLTRIIVRLPDGADRAPLRRALAQRGVATRRGYSLDLRYGSDFPLTLELAPRLLELPSHSRLDEAAIREICAALRESVEHQPTRRPIAHSAGGEAGQSEPRPVAASAG
jgi:dTDP-4-amino-4,6-dideoxygalactose transaminase